MAACELTRNHTTRYCLFAVDSESDLEMLPTSERVGSGDLIRSTTCCVGSIARGSDGTRYVLNGNNKWIEYTGSGGGGGGGGTDIDAITDGEIESLFDDDNNRPIYNEEIDDLFDGDAEPDGSDDNQDGDNIEDITDGEIAALFGNQ